MILFELGHSPEQSLNPRAIENHGIEKMKRIFWNESPVMLESLADSILRSQRVLKCTKKE